jgi:hypothetical protein
MRARVSLAVNFDDRPRLLVCIGGQAHFVPTAINARPRFHSMFTDLHRLRIEVDPHEGRVGSPLVSGAGLRWRERESMRRNLDCENTGRHRSSSERNNTKLSGPVRLDDINIVSYVGRQIVVAGPIRVHRTSWSWRLKYGENIARTPASFCCKVFVALRRSARVDSGVSRQGKRQSTTWPRSFQA